VVATSFFPNTSYGIDKASTATKITTSTTTQVNVATTTSTAAVAGLPHLSTPLGWIWSPKYEGLFIPRKNQPKTIKKSNNKRENSKPAMRGFNLDEARVWHEKMISLVHVDAVQIITERFTTSTWQPIWTVAVKAMEDQLLSHIYNTVGSTSSTTTTTKTTTHDDVNDETVTIAVDPGDFLGEVNGWSAYFDREGTCLVYYFHVQSGVSQWEIPYPNYPVPRLNPQQIQMMKQKYQEQQQQHVMLSTDKENSSTNQIPLNQIFQGIESLFGGGNNKDNKEPEKLPEETNRNNKPWWSSVLDVVFDNQDSKTKERSTGTPVENVKTRDVVDGPLPFFATIQSEDSVAKDSELTLLSTESATADFLQSIDALSTTLSPWWDMLRDVVVKAATSTTVESQSTITNDTPEVSTMENQSNQLWDFLFPSKNDKNKKIDSQTTATLELSNKGQPRTGLEPTADATNNNVLGWMSDLPLFLTRDVSRTVPLFGLFPKKSNKDNDNALIVAATVPLRDAALLNKQKLPSHAERLKVIEEKRYAASRARQANLRKTYGTIIHDRSPTVSLTSIKLQKNKSSNPKNNNIDWYKYLDD
jgi:hypothetical protein